MKAQKAKARENGIQRSTSSPPTSPNVASEGNVWKFSQSPVNAASVVSPSESETVHVPESPTNDAAPKESVDSGRNEKESGPVKKFRGVPENVQLFEVFWKQVVELIKVCSFQFIENLDLLIKCSNHRPELTYRYKTSPRSSSLLRIYH